MKPGFASQLFCQLRRIFFQPGHVYGEQISDGTDALLVLISVPDAASADQATRLVLESRAAACVNRLSECVSTYWRSGVLERVAEIPLLTEIMRVVCPQLEAAVRRAHPYEMSGIIAMPVIAGLLVYLAWVADETRPASV